MNNTYIKRIYLDNFKLFDNFKLDFSEGLNVFDGPNGYGKTSMFDAIEYLITGDIKRVTTCQVLDGKFKYQKAFFSNDYRKDVIVKAEFFNGAENFVMVKRVEGQNDGISTVENNPKKIKEITKTYILPDFEYAQYEDKYLVTNENLESMQVKYFGNTSQTLYSLLYYIQQEDRLDYFKSNESGRVGSINTLFQINLEKEKLDKIKRTKKKITDLIKSIDKKINDLKENICTEIETISEPKTEYQKLLNKEFEWDKEEPIISSKEAFDRIILMLENIKGFVDNNQNYRQDLVNQKHIHFLENETLDVQLNAFAILDAIGDEREEYRKKSQILSFLDIVSEKVKKIDYFGIDYVTLGKYLNKDEECNQISKLVEECNEINKTAASAQKSINDLLEIRKKLSASTEDDIGIHEGKCPYCGYDWKEKKELDIHIQSTTKDIENLLGTAGRHLQDLSKKIYLLFEKNILTDMNAAITEKLEDNLLVAYHKLDEKRAEEREKYVRKFLLDNKFEITSLKNVSEENLKEKIEEIKTKVRNAVVILPEEYYQKKKECGFDDIHKEYFTSLEQLANVDIKAIQEKEKYIKYQFILQESKKMKQVDDLIKKKNCLKNEIEKKMDVYMKDWKTSINKYQGDIISKIEIPFYIYSGRILQSYQGGQGVLIRDRNSKDEVDAIRFTTPNEEHDVLYTMSSGQLSGILLSFSLSLHKIFANDGLNVLFIDDPVQCMDDLNIVSFVELMRTEFPDIQLLISTHEKSFANYILYKYSKYNLQLKRCNLKEINSK
jgi:exonuclease SbcC